MNLLNIVIGRALADEPPIKLTLPKTIRFTGATGFDTLVGDLSDLFFGFLVVAALAGIIYSGVMMITAGGDAAKFAAGRKNLLWSIIGIIVAILAFFIIRFAFSLIGEVAN